MDNKTLEDRLDEIRLLMDYAVPEAHMPEALDLLTEHEADIIGLNLFSAFYGALPEGEDDAIKRIYELFRRQGTFLLLVNSLLGEYLYLVTSEHAAYVGRLAQGVEDPDLLEFLELADGPAFLDKYGEPDDFPVYSPAYLNRELCPFCLVGDGELHIFGCPVEVCPWCGGQLTRCNCRFSQLEQDVLAREREIDALQAKVEAAGRVPFNAREQRPAYPSDTD